MKINRRRKYVKSSMTIRKNRKITSAEEVDEDELEQVEQEFTSKDTSINSTKLPAIYKLVDFPKGTLVLDYGGGRFDNAVEWLAEKEVEGVVYDPYNRSAEHNRDVVRRVRENGGADITLCSNVLNVIKEPEARLGVLKNIRKLTKPSGKVYITVYEGKGTGEGKQSQKDSYQLNRKTSDYLDEVHQVFPDAQRKGKLIFATPTGEVTAASDIYQDEWITRDEIRDGIKHVLDISAENAEIILSWYEDEGAFDDFLDKESFLEFVKDDIWDLLDACDDPEIKERITEDIQAACSKDVKSGCHDKKDVEAKVTTVADIDQFKSKLKTELHHKLMETMTRRDFGFPEEEVDQYTYIDIENTLDGVRVEVRAELSYDGMVKLAEALDEIVSAYDEYAYFDQVTSGIMEAYIRVNIGSKDITSDDHIDYDQDPIDDKKVYTYDFDFNVKVDDEWVDLENDDEEFDEIYDDYYGFTVEDDSDSIAEILLDLLYYNIPDEEGVYRVSGVAKLFYDVDGIYLGRNDDEALNVYNFFESSDAVASYDYAGSYIESLQVEKVK